MNETDFITTKLKKVFNSNMVNAFIPYHAIVYMLANYHASNMNMESYFLEMIQSVAGITESPSIIYWLLVKELKRDLSMLSDDDELDWPKYKALIMAYVGILFAEYIHPANLDKKAKKVFGINSFRVESTDDDLRLYFDEYSVVYELYVDVNKRARTTVSIFSSFLFRIHKFHEKFFSFENHTSYNLYAELFHGHVTSKKYYVRTQYHYETFHTKETIARVYICVISIYFNKKFFVVYGSDVDYYLCAEAKAMAKAVKIINSGKEYEKAMFQANAYNAPIPTNDKLQSYEYRAITHFANKQSPYTLGVVMFTCRYNGKQWCILSANSYSAEDAHYATVVKAIKKMEQLRRDDMFEEFDF